MDGGAAARPALLWRNEDDATPLPLPPRLEGGVALTTKECLTDEEENTPVVVKQWPRGPRSVGRARRLLLRHLAVWELGHVADAAGLVVSELVTNAVRHTDSRHGHLIETRFERLSVGVRIEVHDAVDTRPVRRQATPDDDSGRGLAIVDTLTGGMWGFGQRAGVGKLVWAVCADDGTTEGGR